MNNTGNDLGLIYKQSKIANARYYLPEVGRFISPDTIVPDPSNPQSFNRYAYALNSPTNYIDPSGHDVCTADLSDVECSSGSNLAYITGQPSRGYAYALTQVPFTPTSATDPRSADLRPVVCTPITGCQFVPSIIPTYLASPGAMPGVSRSPQQQVVGNKLDLLATTFDLRATALSTAFTATQVLSAALGGPGLDDAAVVAAYTQADKAENWYSRFASAAVIIGDFVSGESNWDAERMIIGQDTVVLTGATLVGEVAGRPPIIGPFLDTMINLTVNVYDIGRLSGSIPTVFDVRLDASGPHVLFYPR